MANLDPDLLRYVLEIAREFDFERVSVRFEDERFEAELGPKPIIVPAQDEIDPAYEVDEPQPGRDFTIRSGFVGYFQMAVPHLIPGEEIEVGQKLGVVRSLGLPNEIVAESPGVFEEWLIADGSPVEYAQVLAKVKAKR